MESASRIGVIFKRELGGYFATPIASVFLVIFLLLAGAFTFYLGNFFARDQADLLPFFTFHPWLYLVLIPALAMRLWAEERRGGTIELLFTLPVTLWEAVVGKFLAAWCFTGIALALTFPMWLTVNVLGEPDNGVILAGYAGSFLMAGGVYGDWLLRVRLHEKPGDRVCDQRGRGVGLCPQRVPARAGLFQRVGAPLLSGTDQLVQFPDAL